MNVFSVATVRLHSHPSAAVHLLPEQLRLFSRALNMRPAGERQLAWA